MRNQIVLTVMLVNILLLLEILLVPNAELVQEVYLGTVKSSSSGLLTKAVPGFARRGTISLTIS